MYHFYEAFLFAWCFCGGKFSPKFLKNMLLRRKAFGRLSKDNTDRNFDLTRPPHDDQPDPNRHSRHLTILTHMIEI